MRKIETLNKKVATSVATILCLTTVTSYLWYSATNVTTLTVILSLISAHALGFLALAILVKKYKLRSDVILIANLAIMPVLGWFLGYVILIIGATGAIPLIPILFIIISIIISLVVAFLFW